MIAQRAGSLLALATLASTAACHRDPPAPTERMWLVSAPVSPLLEKPDRKKPALVTLHAGDLVYVRGPVTEKGFDRIEWRGAVEGADVARSGQTYEVRRSHADRSLYGFRADYPSEVSVPERGWICAQIASGQGETGVLTEDCSDRLRRTRLGTGDLAAFVPCMVGACPMAVVRGQRVNTIALEGLLDARPVELPDGGGSAMLATTRYVRSDGAWTGGRLAVITTAGGIPARGGEIALDEIDARDASVVRNRLVNVVPTSDGVWLTGESRLVSRDGTEVSKEAVDERYRFTRGGELAR